MGSASPARRPVKQGDGDVAPAGQEARATSAGHAFVLDFRVTGGAKFSRAAGVGDAAEVGEPKSVRNSLAVCDRRKPPQETGSPESTTR